MSRELYNILIEGYYFTHSIGKITDINVIEKLESIFKLGGIYSKNSLKNKGINVQGRVLGNIRIPKDNYVSLFDPSGMNLERRMLSSRFSEFFPLSVNDIILLVDNSVEFSENARRSDFDYHEIIVRDKVSLDYVFGLVIPNDEEIKKMVGKILEQYNIDLCVYDFEGNLLDIRKKGR